MEDYLDKIQSIRGLVVEGTSGSLNKAIKGLDQLKNRLSEIRSQSLLMTVVLWILVSSMERENKETSQKRCASQAEHKRCTRSTARR